MINMELILAAMGQAFFSLSLGMGAIITYGSYLGKKENIAEAAGFVTLADVGIAFHCRPVDSSNHLHGTGRKCPYF